MQQSITGQGRTGQDSSVQYSTVQCSTVQYSTVQPDGITWKLTMNNCFSQINSTKRNTQLVSILKKKHKKSKKSLIKPKKTKK